MFEKKVMKYFVRFVQFSDFSFYLFFFFLVNRFFEIEFHVLFTIAGKKAVDDAIMSTYSVLKFFFIFVAVAIFNITVQILSLHFSRSKLRLLIFPSFFRYIERHDKVSPHLQRVRIGEREKQHKQQSFYCYHRCIGVAVAIFSLLSHFNRNGFYVFARGRRKNIRKTYRICQRISSFIFISFV